MSDAKKSQREELPEEIRTEISMLEKRRNQLEEELSQAEARNRLLARDPSTDSGAVALAFSGVSGLREAITEIDTRVEALEQRLKAAERERAQEATRAKLRKVEREIGEAELDFKTTRTRVNSFLESELGEQVRGYTRWKQLTLLANELRRLLGEPQVQARGMASSEALKFGDFIDALTDNLYRISVQPTREQRRAYIRELSRREAARQATQVHMVKHHSDLGPSPGWEVSTSDSKAEC